MAKSRPLIFTGEPFLSQIDSCDFLPSEYCLMYMPQALYIKFDDVSLQFIPPKICEQHRLVGFCCQENHRKKLGFRGGLLELKKASIEAAPEC